MGKKMKGQLVHSLTRIDIFILPWSSKLFWSSSLLSLFDFKRVLRSRLEVCCRWLIELALPIDSKCNRLAGVMLLLAFLDSLGVTFVLATIGIVDCTFRRIGLHPSCSRCCVWGTAVSLPSQRGGMERKRHLFLYNSFGNLIWLLIFLSCIYNTICMFWISSCKTWQLCRKQ